MPEHHDGYVQWPVVLVAGAKQVPATITIKRGEAHRFAVTPFRLQINTHELDYLMKKLNG